MSQKLKELKQHIPKHLLKTQMPPMHPLGSGLTSFDSWLNGGLAWGRISEWGMPRGSDTRKLICSFLKNENKNFLWIYSSKFEEIYPPSWNSQLDLNKAYFLCSDAPVKELKSCFLDKYFSLIIIDSPVKLNLGDIAFLSSQARNFQQHIFLLRPFYLSTKKGNPYTQHRINVFRKHRSSYELKKLRGPGANTSLHLKTEEIFDYDSSSSFF